MSSAVSSIVAFFIARRAALGFPRRRIHAIARSRALRLDGRAAGESAVQRRTLRFTPARCRGRRGRRDPHFLRSRAVSASPSAARRLRASGPHPHPVVVAARARTLGIRGLALHVPCLSRPLHSPPLFRAVWDTVPQRDIVLHWDTKPLRDTVPLRDTLPLRDTISLRDAMPQRDTVPQWDAVPPWDTVPLRDALPLHGAGYDGQNEQRAGQRAHTMLLTRVRSVPTPARMCAPCLEPQRHGRCR